MLNPSRLGSAVVSSDVTVANPAHLAATGERPPAGTAGLRQLRRLLSDDLLGAANEIEILHGDALYRLRRTSLGKLILTK
jgi:hemin uptake protein HemP